MRIIIDGISGSGKTTLAARLGAGFQVLHLDDWYPGWDGLAAGTQIAQDLLSGQRADFPRWDWMSEQVSELVPVDPALSWIVEGCGALTPATAAMADLCIWVDAPVEIARARALERDGEAYLPWWEAWHLQELEHWALNDPRALADLVVSGG